MLYRNVPDEIMIYDKTDLSLQNHPELGNVFEIVMSYFKFRPDVIRVVYGPRPLGATDQMLAFVGIEVTSPFYRDYPYHEEPFHESLPAVTYRDRIEDIVLTVAHELQHVQQIRSGRMGAMSEDEREVEAERTAIRVLKHFRQDRANIQQQKCWTETAA